MRARSERTEGKEEEEMWRTWWWKHDCRRYGRTRHVTVSSRQERGVGVERAISSMMRRRVPTTRSGHGVRTSCESTVLSRGSIRPHTSSKASVLSPRHTHPWIPSIRIKNTDPFIVHVRMLPRRSAVFVSPLACIRIADRCHRRPRVSISNGFPYFHRDLRWSSHLALSLPFPRKGRLQPIERDALRHTFTRGCSDTTRGCFLGHVRIDVKRNDLCGMVDERVLSWFASIQPDNVRVQGCTSTTRVRCGRIRCTCSCVSLYILWCRWCKAGAPGVLLDGLDSSNPPSPPLGRTQRPCPSRDHRDRETILCGTTTIRVSRNPRGWSFRESAMGRISENVMIAPILPIVSHSIGVDCSTIPFESSILVSSRQTSHRLNRSLPGSPLHPLHQRVSNPSSFRSNPFAWPLAFPRPSRTSSSPRPQPGSPSDHLVCQTLTNADQGDDPDGHRPQVSSW